MKKIYSNIIPPAGYKAMCLWPFLFIRKKATLSVVDERHEGIHGAQQREMLIAGVVTAVILLLLGAAWWSLAALPLFFWWYGVEWLIKGICYRNFTTAYRNISFEREAYANQYNTGYLTTRKHYAWLKYLSQH